MDRLIRSIILLPAAYWIDHEHNRHTPSCHEQPYVVNLSNLQLFCCDLSTLQRTNTENWKQIFLEKELRGHSPNVQMHVYVSGLYIPTIELPILLQEICGPILGIYKSLTNTSMCKLGLRVRNSPKRNT
jgi:hypothetical protein